METKKVRTIEWNEDLSDIENRARRITDIIKTTKCKKPDDIREAYLNIYLNDEDYLPYESNHSYQSKALKKIPNLVVPKNKEDYYVIEESEEDVSYRNLRDLFKQNKMNIKVIETARVVMPRKCVHEFIKLIEEQFDNIVSFECLHVANNKEAIYITYSKKMPKPKPKKKNDEEIYYYEPTDFYETMSLINDK